MLPARVPADIIYTINYVSCAMQAGTYRDSVLLWDQELWVPCISLMTFLQLGHDCFLLQHEHSIFPVTTNLISHWSIKHFQGIRKKRSVCFVLYCRASVDRSTSCLPTVRLLGLPTKKCSTIAHCQIIETTVHALMMSLVDYCNTVMAGTSKTQWQTAMLVDCHWMVSHWMLQLSQVQQSYVLWALQLLDTCL